MVWANRVAGRVPVYETKVNKIDKFAISLKPRTLKQEYFFVFISAWLIRGIELMHSKKTEKTHEIEYHGMGEPRCRKSACI